MRYSEAMYWTRRKLDETANSICAQDYMSNDERKLYNELDDAIDALSRLEDLIEWLETNNYIVEEI